MKAHIYTSDSPVTEGEPLTALCGSEIAHAKFGMTWDSEEMGDPTVLSTLIFCKKCSLKCAEEMYQGGKRYFYGVCEAQEALAAGQAEGERP